MKLTTWLWFGFAVALAIGAYFLYGHVKSLGYSEAEIRYLDSLSVVENRWRGRMAEHLLEDVRREAERVKNIVPVTPRPTTNATEVVINAMQLEKEELKKFIEKLAFEKLFYDTVGFDFENEYFRFGINAYGIHYPLDDMTIVEYNPRAFELKALPRDTVVITVAQTPFWEGIVLGGALHTRFKDIKAINGGMSVMIPFNVSGVRIIPNAGFHTLLKDNYGINFEWKIN